MSKNSSEIKKINSIEDDSLFNQNSIKLLYSLPLNSFTLINDDKSDIFLAKIVNFETKSFNDNEGSYKKYLEKQTTYNRNTLLKSYDIFLNGKYKVDLNQQTIDRVKNYFK